MNLLRALIERSWFFLFRDCVSSESLKFYSEAAVFENKWFSGEWPPAMKELHITFKELFPIVLPIEIWGHILSNHKVLCLTDNMTFAEIINKISSKDKILMKLVRRMVLAALKSTYISVPNILQEKQAQFVICFLISPFRRHADWLLG